MAHSHKKVFDVSSVFLGILAELSPGELLYWLRSGDELRKILKKGKIDFVQESKSVMTLPSLNKAKTLSLLNGSPFKYHGRLNEDLYKEYDSTEMRQVFYAKLACDLLPEELYKKIAGKYIISECIYTPLQIKYLAKNQSSENSPGLLSFKENNYFLIENNRGKIIVVCMSWHWPRVPSETKKKRTNMWKMKWCRPEMLIEKTGKIFLHREIP